MLEQFWSRVLGKEWLELLSPEITEAPQSLDLATFISAISIDKTIEFAPAASNIFRVFTLIKPSQVKVLCMGQDPYHSKKKGKIVADGIAFSTAVNIIPPSLQNIFRELYKEGYKNYPKTGNLTPWVEEGVLLLNRVLTVELGKPNSHSKKEWEWFTSLVIKKLSEKKEGIVFLLWGEKALKSKKYIYNVKENKHLILTTGHPSPYSYNNGFENCGHFTKTNEYLKSIGKTPINWG